MKSVKTLFALLAISALMGGSGLAEAGPAAGTSPSAGGGLSHGNVALRVDKPGNARDDISERPLHDRRLAHLDHADLNHARCDKRCKRNEEARQVSCKYTRAKLAKECVERLGAGKVIDGQTTEVICRGMDGGGRVIKGCEYGYRAHDGYFRPIPSPLRACEHLCDNHHTGE